MVLKFLAVAVVVGVIVFLMTRALTRLRITKSFIKNELKAVWPNETYNDQDIEINEIALSDIKDKGEALDKVAYSVRVRNTDGVLRKLELRTFNPAAEFEEEAYQAITENTRPKDEGMSAGGGDVNSLASGHVAGIEIAQGMLHTQAKMEGEERVINARRERIKLDIEITKKLASYGDILPTIYRHNIKKICALTDSTGDQSLVAFLEGASREQKMTIYRQIVTDLANVQNHFGSVSIYLPGRQEMDIKAYRSMLSAGLGQLKKANLLTKEQTAELLNEYYPIAEYLADHFKTNLYFSAFSPYNFYVNDGKGMVRDWSNYDTGQMWVNLIELLKDPISDLNAAEEAALLKLYIANLDTELTEEEALKQYDLSSCHLLTVQLCYMKIYQKRVADMPEEKRRVLRNWDQQHIDTLLTNALAKWTSYDESKAFAELLTEIFASI